MLADLGVGLEPARTRVRVIEGPGEPAPSGHIPFTPRVKKILERSRREALALRHDFIGTEHLLLALSFQEGGVAMRVLNDLDLTGERIREAVHERIRANAPTRLDDLAGESSEGDSSDADEPLSPPDGPDEAARRAARAHIVAGMRRGLGEVDEIIRVLRTCPSRPEAVQALLDRGYSEIQAHHVLDMPMQRLLGAQQAALRTELAELESPEDPA